MPLLPRRMVGMLMLGLFTIWSIGWMIIPSGTAAAESERPTHPPVFQPGEVQHGFSAFDTLPDIPLDDAPPDGQDASPSNVDPIGSRSAGYDVDQKPGGLFHRIQFAEGFEELEGLRRGHTIVPVGPRTVFPPETRAVFLTFTVHKHLSAYQIFGRLYPERVEGLKPSRLLDEDTMLLAAEDDSGYLQFFPKAGRWAPGIYRVNIFVGYEANEINHVGTMRFTVQPSPS